MFSFMKIATIAALMFGTFASAIPAPAPILETSALQARGGGETTVTDVLVDLNINLKVQVDLLSSFCFFRERHNLL